ncbi:MAG: DUF4288 domain-containing protein [Chitinophagaceae bacterium]|nr:DUF4288 domain-containing protein [Chitinophagaceae bacterium]MCB0741511.1 DUF4288 domain-containing protein [Chitinophagaceae bacterium]HQV06276.1 DUF4288 domain-containing protein [Chitinophagaceae bacterium]
MHWYITKIVFQILQPSSNSNAEFDEQLCMLRASNQQEAFAKAEQLGRKKSDRFLNHKNEWIEWKFIAVTEIKSPGDIEDGTEIYSRIEEKENAALYLHIIHQKSAQLQQQCSLSLLQVD